MLNFIWQGFLTRGLYVLLGIVACDVIHWMAARFRPEPPRKHRFPLWADLVLIGLLVLFFSCVPPFPE